MGLKEQLESDMKEAMRAREPRRLSAIRMLRAAITNYEIARTDRKNPRFGQPVAEADLVGVLQKEINQRKEAIEFAKQANRPDLIEKEQAELAALSVYMPAQMSRDEIQAEVEPLVAEHGRDFRKVMPLAAQKLKGRAEGRLVNEVVKELTG